MNLQKSRVLFALTTVGFLVVCNLGYLYANSPERRQVFSNQIDQPPIQILSLLLLIGIIGFALVKPQEPGEDA